MSISRATIILFATMVLRRFSVGSAFSLRLHNNFGALSSILSRHSAQHFLTTGRSFNSKAKTKTSKFNKHAHCRSSFRHYSITNPYSNAFASSSSSSLSYKVIDTNSEPSFAQTKESTFQSAIEDDSIYTMNKDSNVTESTKTKRSGYTLDNDFCVPTNKVTLQRIVHTHLDHFERYLKEKPIAPHTQASFDQVLQLIVKFKPKIDNNSPSSTSTYQFDSLSIPTATVLPKVILDSGCGTGRSSIRLGKLHPDCIVIGVDRSIKRLQRNKIPNMLHTDQSDHVDNNNICFNGSLADEFTDEANADLEVFVEQKADNVFLVRAELADFWQCCWQQQPPLFTIHSHYLLYPNPYPKKSRLKNRWYAHPALPLLLHNVGGDGATSRTAVDNDDTNVTDNKTINDNNHAKPSFVDNNKGKLVIRSNWKTYVDEFAFCVQTINDMIHRQKHIQQQSEDSPYIEETINTDQISSLLPPGPFEISEPQILHNENDTLYEYWTNFEQKYMQAGETIYELVITKAIW